MSSAAEKRRSSRSSRPVTQQLRQVHSAIKRSNIDHLRTLLQDPAECHLDVPYAGMTALQLAVSLDAEDACKMLLEAGACPDTPIDDNDGYLLHQAVRRGKSGTVRILVGTGTNLEVSNADGSTPLNIAAELGLVDIAEELVKGGCFLDRQNRRGWTPFISAAHGGHVDLVKMLVAAKCDVSWKDNEKRNALMVAIEEKQNGVIQFLITSSGIDLNAVDQYGRTAVYLAAKLGQIDVVQGLIAAKADINRPDTRGCTPFTEAVANYHMDVAYALLWAGCNVNTARYENLEAPIHSAIKFAAIVYGQRELQLELVVRLLEAECDVNIADKEGCTPLFYAASNGDTVIVKMLLEKKADVTRVTRSKDTVLHGSVCGNSPEIVELLIKAGCPVNSVNQMNELPLYTAIARRADNEIIRLLLDAGSLMDVCEQKTHQSPLFVAIQQRYTEAVELLIKSGCDVNLQNRDGNSPLWIACTRGCEDIVRILLSHPKVIIDLGIHQVPLHAAATLGFREIAKLLLEAGCDVNRLSDAGVSALYLAAEMNHFPLAQLLVHWGANPSAPHMIKPPAKCCRLYKDAHPHLELEPLFAAVQNDNFKMVKLILTASPRIPYRVLTTLRDILFRTNYAREAQLTQQAIYQYAQFFVNILSRPRSLKDECRGIVREFLGKNPRVKVDCLPLPGPLKDYVLLSGCSIMKE